MSMCSSLGKFEGHIGQGVHLPALLESPAILEHGLSASAEKLSVEVLQMERLGAVWVSAFKAAFPLFPRRARSIVAS